MQGTWHKAHSGRPCACCDLEIRLVPEEAFRGSQLVKDLLRVTLLTAQLVGSKTVEPFAVLYASIISHPEVPTMQTATNHLAADVGILLGCMRLTCRVGLEWPHRCPLMTELHMGNKWKHIAGEVCMKTYCRRGVNGRCAPVVTGFVGFEHHLLDCTYTVCIGHHALIHHSISNWIQPTTLSNSSNK